MLCHGRDYSRGNDAGAVTWTGMVPWCRGVLPEAPLAGWAPLVPEVPRGAPAGGRGDGAPGQGLRAGLEAVVPSWKGT